MTKTSNSSGSTADGGSTNEELSNAPTTGGNIANAPNGQNSQNGPNGGLRKGPWTASEDAILIDHVRRHGEGNWNAVQRSSGLARCGKSCRLRWANHLRPNLKKGPFSPEEELLILRLHARLGNKWARISTHLPGRTDNEIKNYWNTRLKRRQRANLPLYPSEIERELGVSRKFNQNMSQFADNRNPNLGNLNTQLLLQPSPLNYSNPQNNGIGPNPLMNQNFQTFSNYPSQIQDVQQMLQYGPKGHNQGQFRPQMGYGMTNYNTNPSNMMPNFPTVKTEISSSQMYLDQTPLPRPGTNNMGGTMFDAQQGGNFQNVQKMPSLAPMPQLIRGDQNQNWSNGNGTNMGGNNGGMNRQGDGNGLDNKWNAGPDCMNGGANNMMLKDVEMKMEELKNLIGVNDPNQFHEWALNAEMPINGGAEISGGGGGGGSSVITDDGLGLTGVHQHFVPPVSH